jgi:hypothetical protein
MDLPVVSNPNVPVVSYDGVKRGSGWEKVFDVLKSLFIADSFLTYGPVKEYAQT